MDKEINRQQELLLDNMKKYLDASPLLTGTQLSLSELSLRNCKSGQIIGRHITGGRCIGLIGEGMIDVYTIAHDGNDILLNTLKNGDCFGISNLFSRIDIDISLRCRQNTKIILIPKAQLVALIKQDNSFAIRYASLCTEKLHFLIGRIEQLTIQSCHDKVVSYLLSHQDEYGIIYPRCSREELAKQLGISRAALFRELSSLVKNRILELNRNSIKLLYPEKLI